MLGGFDLDDFEVDAEAATMTCPAGVTVTLTPKGRATARAILEPWRNAAGTDG